MKVTWNRRPRMSNLLILKLELWSTVAKLFLSAPFFAIVVVVVMYIFTPWVYF
jgi:hypothetical protein